VDGELLSLVRLEVEEVIGSTSLSGIPIISVSAITGEGLPDLISAIERELASTEARKDVGRPRLAIDRAFTIAGAGTVVTGTLIDGSFSVGQDIEIVPRGLKARLRGLQTHKTKVDVARPGSRVAANLVGVAISQLERGDVLTKQGWLVPTTRADIRLRLLSDVKRPLRHGATISFYAGTAEMMAKIHLLETEEIKPGEAAWAQLALDRPVAIVKDDHFIIRSPMSTLGGGTIVSAQAQRHRRFRPEIVQALESRGEGTAEEAAMAAIEANQPLALGALSVRCNLSGDDAGKIVDVLARQGKLVLIGSGDSLLIFTTLGWERLANRAVAIVEEYHRRFPARMGMPKGELVSKLEMAPNSPALQMLFGHGTLVESGVAVSLPSHQVQLKPEQQAKVDVFLHVLNESPYSPPGDMTLEPDLLNLLIAQDKVVKVHDGVVFSSSAYEEMVSKVMAYARSKGKITLAEVRDLLGTSRKYATALLEYMDEKKLTRRVGDERVLR
jgi:selenocysteine-specific elongation factor